jgi:hypothetical protein
MLLKLFGGLMICFGILVLFLTGLCADMLNDSSGVGDWLKIVWLVGGLFGLGQIIGGVVLIRAAIKRGNDL